MRRDRPTRRDTGPGARRREARPRLESLEDRYLLYATTGSAWPHPALITYSFMPDGTDVGGAPSDLFQAFNAKWSTATWESIFTTAAAIWEQVANIDLIQVSDNGMAMGTGPDQQGNPGIGDIRIGGQTSAFLGSGTLAYTLYPPPINGTSSAGDMLFNTSQSWQINSNYDLLTVAIHEFGHALGLGESHVAQASMYGTYTGIDQSLNSDDIAGIDAIYGTRPPDWMMANFNNNASSRAFDVTPYLNAQDVFAYGSLDLQTPVQTEWFKVTVPANTSGTMTVSAQATNLSLLCPGVVIYNSSLQYLGAAGNPYVYSNTAVIQLVGVSPNQVYYIQTYGIGGAQADAGNYALLVSLGSTPAYPFSSPVTTTPNHYGGGGGGGGYDHIPGGGTGVDPGWLVRIDQMDSGHADSPQAAGQTARGSIDAQSALPLAQVDPTRVILLVAPPDSSDAGITTDSSTPAGPRKPGRASLLAAPRTPGLPSWN